MTYFGRMVMLICKQYLDILLMNIDYCSTFFLPTISYEHVFIVIKSFMEEYPIKTFHSRQDHLNFPLNNPVLQFLEIAELPCSLDTNIQLFCLNYSIKETLKNLHKTAKILQTIPTKKKKNPNSRGT